MSATATQFFNYLNNWLKVSVFIGSRLRYVIHTCTFQYLLFHLQNKTIHGYSQESLPELPFNPLDCEMCHLTYDEFNKSGVKTKPPSVSECWKRMLMCIPNVSLDKANCIVQHYPTLKRFVCVWGCNQFVSHSTTDSILITCGWLLGQNSAPTAVEICGHLWYKPLLTSEYIQEY